MWLKINLGELSHINKSSMVTNKVVPVTINFDPTKPIGSAQIKSFPSGLFSELHIKKEIQERIEPIKEFFELGISGTVIEREGDLIKKFNIQSVSITTKDGRVNK